MYHVSVMRWIYCDHSSCKEKVYSFLFRTGAKVPRKITNKQSRGRKAGSLSESSTNRNNLKSECGNNGSRKHKVHLQVVI